MHYSAVITVIDGGPPAPPAGLTLRGLKEGNWLELTEKEMIIIQDAVANAAGPGMSTAGTPDLSPGSPTYDVTDYFASE